MLCTYTPINTPGRICPNYKVIQHIYHLNHAARLCWVYQLTLSYHTRVHHKCTYVSVRSSPILCQKYVQHRHLSSGPINPGTLPQPIDLTNIATHQQLLQQYLDSIDTAATNDITFNTVSTSQLSTTIELYHNNQLLCTSTGTDYNKTIQIVCRDTLYQLNYHLLAQWTIHNINKRVPFEQQPYGVNKQLWEYCNDVCCTHTQLIQLRMQQYNRLITSTVIPEWCNDITNKTTVSTATLNALTRSPEIQQWISHTIHSVDDIHPVDITQCNMNDVTNIIQYFGGRGDLYISEMLLNQLQMQQRDTKRKLYTMINTYCVLHNCRDVFFRICKQAEYRFACLPTSIGNQLIQYYCSQHDLVSATKILHMMSTEYITMKQLKDSGNVYASNAIKWCGTLISSFNILIQSHSLQNNQSAAFELVRQAIGNNHTINNGTFKSLLYSCQSSDVIRKQTEIVEYLGKLCGWSSDGESVKLMISSAYKQQQYQYITALYETTINDNPSMKYLLLNDLYVVPILMNCYAKIGRLDDMKQFELYQRDSLVYAASISHATNTNDAQQQFDKAINDGVQLNNGIYNALIYKYAKAGQFYKVLSLYNEMIANGITPNTQTYDHLLRGCKMIQFEGFVHAYRLYYELLNHPSLKPTESSHSNYIDVCGNNKRYKDALKCYRLLREQSDYIPSDRVYLSLMRALAVSGQHTLCEQIMHDCITIGEHTVNDVHYSLLMLSYANANNRRHSISYENKPGQLLINILNNQIELSATVLNRTLDACVMCRPVLHDVAHCVIDLMYICHDLPDNITRRIISKRCKSKQLQLELTKRIKDLDDHKSSTNYKLPDQQQNQIIINAVLQVLYNINRNKQIYQIQRPKTKAHVKTIQ